MKAEQYGGNGEEMDVYWFPARWPDTKEGDEAMYDFAFNKGGALYEAMTGYVSSWGAGSIYVIMKNHSYEEKYQVLWYAVENGGPHYDCETGTFIK